MVGFSLPTTGVYFFGLWAIGIWKPRLLNSSGLAIAGFVSAIYPAFCGVWPIYAFRFGIAVPFIAAQFTFIVAVAGVFSMLENYRES